VLYSFLLERDFLVPDATPVIAHIGNERLIAQIIAIQGMEITLGLQRDLGPTIARVEISVDPTAILERILTRLQDPAIAGLSDTLARMVFGYERPRFGQGEFKPKIKISDEQHCALRRAIGSQVQFIWGPPGTGKTQALAALCEVLVEDGESVLLTSHTNVAVDEAILRAAGPPSGERAQGPLFQTPAYFNGKLLRYGPPKHAEFAQIIDELSAEAISKRLARNLEARLSEIAEELDRIDQARRPLRALLKGQFVEDVGTALASGLQQRFLSIHRELEEVGDTRRKAEAILTDWRKVERFGEEVRSRGRALDGAVASLNKRRREYEAAGTALTRARERLEDALNPRGLRRLFRKDARPFQLGVRDAERSLRLVAESLSAAQAWEDRARTAVDAGQVYLSQLIPVVPKADILRRIDEMNSRAASLYAERERVEAQGLREVAQLDSRAAALDDERSRVQAEIDGIIERVITNAQFVGTTLTRAATDDVLLKRKFDTVIIDEASMAPLPLVYLAALVAEKRVILVGDFRQLPPIVQSPETSELAQKWLGRDIFRQSGIDTPDLPQDKHNWRANLWVQHRMAPAIRQFASDKFYEGRLRDYDGDRTDDKRWAERPPAGRAVCLVDTTSLGAWSQRSPGVRPSKFNIYSALVATELAELLVQDMDRDSGNSGSHPVGIITPYRAQANLLNVLVRERGLRESVHAGTVHSFQGTESQAIIFDYVEDEPYWKAGPLLLGEGGERLMNVAVTRARNRLLVIGSYAHVRQQLKKSSLWDLVDYARKLQHIDAREFLRADFHRAVAEANARISHGSVSGLDAHHLRVLSERDFFAALDYDLERAKPGSRAVLFSAFLGRRAEDVMPRLKVCVDSGVDVYVVTLPLADVRDSAARSFYAATHRRLEQLGVKLVFFRDMHHKLVFVDDHILYVGGLNPLSHRHTAETMDRWDSKNVFRAHAEQVRLNDLLAMWEDPSDQAMRTCPRPECKGAPLLIVAPVTFQQYDPIYWGCTNWPKCTYVRRFSSGARRSGARVCDQCGAAMRLERKPAAVWWVCPSCRARRKVQEGEASNAEIVRVQHKPTPKSRPRPAAQFRPPGR
jgi:hypothetical protein